MAWTDLLEQPQVVRILRAHLARRRVAPAYLFIGPEGAGKRLAALELAKALNCDRAETEACGTCGQCHRLTQRVHPDLHVLEVQGASQTIQIDEVRTLLGRIALRPYMGRRSVVIIDGAERLTEEAANSLLKALEEPPGRTTFLLLTVHPAFCLPTIVSRCQAIRFRRPPPPQPREADQQIRTQVTAALSGRSPIPMPPNDRQELSRWCEQTIQVLRDAAVGDRAGTIHAGEEVPQNADSAAHRTQQLDRDRCIGAALECIAWAESLTEQYVSPRLVATLLREQWLMLSRR